MQKINYNHSYFKIKKLLILIFRIITNFIRFAFPLLVIFSLFTHPLTAQSKDTIQIEWQKVRGASAYLLEIRDEKGDLVFSEKTKETLLSIELAPGNYTKRLTVFNPYGQIGETTEWAPLLVKERPGIKVMLEWDEISTAKKYILEIKDSNGVLLKRKEVDSNSATIRLEPGHYEKRLLVVNQFGETESEGAWSPLHVILVLTPEIENKPQLIKNAPQKQQLIVKGKNFEKGISAEFYSNDKENKIKIQNLEVEDSETIKLSIKMKEDQTGSYTLRLKNERGKEASAENYLTIQNAEVSEKAKDKIQNWEILLRSSVVPGWGQIYAGNKYDSPNRTIRGYVFSSVFFSAVLYNLYLYNSFHKIERDIKRDSTIGMIAGLNDAMSGNEGDSLSSLVLVPSLLEKKAAADDLVIKNRQTNNLMLGIYLIQVIDAYFINRDVNAKLEQEGLQVSYEKNKLFYGEDHRFSVNYIIRF